MLTTLLDLVRSYKMENIKVFTAINLDGSEVEHIEITHPEGWTTTMPKAVWDELEAAKQTGTIS